MEIVKFQDAKIPCIVQEDKKIYVVIKPICDAIGVNHESTIRSLKNHPVLRAEHTVLCVQVDGKQRREYTVLPIQFISGWLFSININKVKQDAKPKLFVYQRKCFDVLNDHFFGNLRRQLEWNEQEILLLNEMNELNEKKNEFNNILRDKKRVLDKLRQNRLIKQPMLFP